MEHSSCLFLIFFVLQLIIPRGAHGGATFTFANRCEFTVWPGILANAGSPRLDTTGFELPKQSTRTLEAPAGWSGRFWGRTGCKFDGSGIGSCLTGDCGSGQVECSGNGAEPPTTLAEFTLGTGGQDFYDVSLVDGYNLPMIVEGTGGSGNCASTGCVTDLNQQCPSELKSGNGEACKSACEAFGTPEYCCSGAYGTPAACKPSIYSEMFKAACPRSYSYAYDDATSTFTCTGADYTITFCPSSPSQKSIDTTPMIPGPPSQGQQTGSQAEPGYSGTGYGGPGTVSQSQSGYPGSVYGGSGSDTQPGSNYPGFSSNYPGSAYTSGTGNVGARQAALSDGSWLAGLAMGDSNRIVSTSYLHLAVIALGCVYVSSIFSFQYL